MRKHRSKSHGFTLKAAILSATSLTLLAGVGFAALQSFGKPTPDAMNCYDVPGQQLVDVWLDASSPRFNAEQARSLRTYVDNLYDALPFNARLSVFTSEGDIISSDPKPRFHVCGAANTPDELKEIGAAPAEAGFLAKQKQRIFENTLAPELDLLLALESEEPRRQESQSPILESIHDLARIRAGVKSKRKLIIISDLIQNSDSAQFCRVQNAMPRFSVFKQRPVYARLAPEALEGVEVEVLFLQRPGYGQPGLQYCASEEEIKTFYRDYFTEYGVSDLRFIRIRHGYAG